jgi:hypothetical protein
MEPTPDTSPGDFEAVGGSKARRNKITGEIWERTFSIRITGRYKDRKKWEAGVRDRAVWDDELGPRGAGKRFFVSAESMGFYIHRTHERRA